MRIIAGRLRGRRITAPTGLSTRPMLERVRQAVFDVIGSRWAMPGQLPPIAVLDMFAGSGALGIESLSRGAAFCTFVERKRHAAAYLRRQLDQCGLADQSVVLVGDAMKVAPLPSGGEAYQLVFLDPPYIMSCDTAPTGTMGRLLARLGDDIPLAGDALVVLRHERQYDYSSIAYGQLSSEDRREYGTMAVTFLTLTG